MIAYCKYHGIGIIPWQALGGGALARPPNTETPRTKLVKDFGMSKDHPVDAEIIKRVQEIATKRGWAMSQVIDLRVEISSTMLTVPLGRACLGSAHYYQPHRWLQLRRACRSGYCGRRAHG